MPNFIKLVQLTLFIVLSITCNAQEKKDSNYFFDHVNEEYHVVLNKKILQIQSVQNEYPAVAINMTSNKFVKVLPNIISKGDTSEREIRKLDADLFIEPRDPEIAIFPGKQTKLKIVDQKWNYYNLKNAQDIIFDEDSLRDIKSGVIFLLKMENNIIFQIKIEHFSSENEEMTLIYKLLK